MRKFNERTLHDQSYSDFDCFISGVNQESVLNEVSAFGDEELLASFEKMFEDADEEETDSYLTGTGIVGVEQIASMTVCPDVELQKDILQNSSKDAQVLLVSKFKLERVIESFMLRICSEEVIFAYFERYQLEDTAQDYLVQHALKDDYYKKLFFVYVSKQSLDSLMVIPLIKAQADVLLKAYAANHSLGYEAINWCVRNKKENYLLQFIQNPLDKLMLALILRVSTKKIGKLFSWVNDMSNELKQLSGRESMYFAAPLSSAEEKCLVNLTNTNLLKRYITRFALSSDYEKVMLYHHDNRLLEYYFQRYGLCTSSLIEILRNDWIDMFLMYIRLHPRKSSYLLSKEAICKFAGKKIKTKVQESIALRNLLW